MAMNPRGGYSGYRYGGYNFNRRKQPVRHENFEPISEQREEDGALIILVHLPGFLQEQITISMIESTSYIRVFGERVANNIRFRFNTGYSVPKDCNMSEMNAQFGLGILTIRIPKIIIATQTDPKELEAITRQEAHPSPDEETTREEPKLQTIEELGTPLKQTLSNTTVDEQTEGKDVEEAVSPQKAATEMISQKGQDEASQKANLLADTTKKIDEKIVGNGGGTVDQKAVEKTKKSEARGKPIQAENLSPLVIQEDGIDDKSKGSLMAASGAQRSEEKEKEKEKEKSEKAGGDDDKEKPNKADIASREAKDMENASASANKSGVKDGTIGVKEERRQLILNVFAAVALIMAIGTHMFYSAFGNSG